MFVMDLQDTHREWKQSGPICHVLRLSVRSNFLQPMDCSPPGSRFHGILQARIQEWVAISYSRGVRDVLSPALAGKFFITSAT